MKLPTPAHTGGRFSFWRLRFAGDRHIETAIRLRISSNLTFPDKFSNPDGAHHPSGGSTGEARLMPKPSNNPTTAIHLLKALHVVSARASESGWQVK
jgi:hypothetical protein